MTDNYLDVVGLLTAPVPPELDGRLQLPRCPHCRRRPLLVESRAPGLTVRVSDFSTETVQVPRYELLPCCSASYVKTVDHVTRKQQLRALAEKEIKV